MPAPLEPEQWGGGGSDHPVRYYSFKFKRHQLNYSATEKETPATLLALQHFEVDVGSSPSQVIQYTDHHPLVFLSQMYKHKQRLMCWALLVQRFFFCWLHHCYSPHFPWTTLGTKQGKIGFIRAWSWSAVHLYLYKRTAWFSIQYLITLFWI